MKNSECPFCREQKNPRDSIVGKSRIIAETQNFIVFPTTGGFVNNYQLIVPKEHINCFGELSISELKELKDIIEWQKEINRVYFNMSSSMFEHDALKPTNESGKSIIHAHLHIFPNNKSLLKDISKYEFGLEEINDISDLRNICRNYEKYLYYSDIDGRNYIMTHQGIPSQFLRKVLANSLQLEEWNWREYPYIEAIEESLKFYKEKDLIYKKERKRY